MTTLLPTACCISGVIGWNVYQSVTLIGSLPVAGVTLLHPAPMFGGGEDPRPPRGPFGVPFPAVLGSVMKIQPVLTAGFGGDPCGIPPLGRGPFGQAGGGAGGLGKGGG